jgi:TRAP-type C4-dicarboxylate transport system substrate-binding protein
MSRKKETCLKLNITLFLILVFLTNLAHGQHVIKFATQAPEGSAWIKVMEEYNKDVQELTNGQVKFKIYPGGIQGDELGVLRKIRFGSLQSAGFTGVGAGEILSEFRILEAPMLLQNYKEVDYITSLLYDELAKKFEANDFVLLGLTEVGFVYVFGQKPITSISDLRNVKMWMWEGDPLAEAVFKSMGANAIPLSITDVLTSLQTNLIEAVYTSPLACVTLQWYTRVKYMMDLPLTNSFGAILLSKKMYDKIQPEYQKILVEKGREHMKRLVQLSRQSNQESIELMKKNGIQVIKVPEENLKGFYDAAQVARKSLVGKLYSAELLWRVETAVQELRAGKVSTQ